MKRGISGKNTIRRSIRRKLGSDAGASITFALLLFLVCAMVSAVVLVAATTASGRMAGIAEADQRYYAVTSAAELLKDVMSEKTVTVMTIGGETVSVAKPANQVTVDDINRAGSTAYQGDAYIKAGDDDTFGGVSRPATKTGTPFRDALVKKLSELTLADEGEDRSFSFTLTVDVGGETVSDLTVNVVAAIDENDNAVFTISSSDPAKPFRMIMNFSADSKHNVRPSVSGVDIGDANEISWHLERVLTSYDASILDAEEGE